MPTRKTPIADRLAGKYTIDIETGCWIWHSSRSTQGKYPTIASEDNGRIPVYAYRYVYEQAHGPIPTSPCPDGSDRWEVHHICGSHSCINPDHLMLVTRKQHIEEHRIQRAARNFRMSGIAISLLRAGRSIERVRELTRLPKMTMRHISRYVAPAAA